MLGTRSLLASTGRAPFASRSGGASFMPRSLQGRRRCRQRGERNPTPGDGEWYPCRARACRAREPIGARVNVTRTATEQRVDHPVLGGPPHPSRSHADGESGHPRDEERRHDVQPAQPQLPEGDRLRAAGAAVPAAARRGAEDRQVRRHRGQAPRGQGDRADLREDLDAHAVGVRGRRVRSGCPRHLPRPVRIAARPQGVGGRHRPGARPDVRRHRVPRQRAGRRRGAGRARRRARLQRPDRTSGTRRRCWPTS